MYSDIESRNRRQGPRHCRRWVLRSPKKNYYNFCNHIGHRVHLNRNHIFIQLLGDRIRNGDAKPRWVTHIRFCLLFYDYNSLHCGIWRYPCRIRPSQGSHSIVYHYHHRTSVKTNKWTQRTDEILISVSSSLPRTREESYHIDREYNN